MGSQDVQLPSDLIQAAVDMHSCYGVTELLFFSLFFFLTLLCQNFFPSPQHPG